MARARNIKPGLYKNEDLAECSLMARYIFPGMWMLADREGRMEDRPKRIKAELLPFDDGDMDALLAELARFGFIVRYEVDGARYIQIAKFGEHQTPHVREQASTIPGPEKASQSTAKVVPSTDQGSALSSPRSPDSLIPSSLIPDSLSSDTEEKPIVEAKAPIVRRKTDRPDDAVQIFEHWQRVTGHHKSVLDAKRVSIIKARLKDGYTVEQLCQAIDGNRADPWHQGANDRQNIVDGLHYICRDGPTVEKFIAIAERGPPSGRSANAQQTIDNLQAYLEQNP